MKKLAMTLGAVLAIVGVAAIYLGQELHAQRAQNAAVMARVMALEAGNPAGSITAPPAGNGAQSAALNAATAAPTPSAPASSALTGRGQLADNSTESMFAKIVEQMRNSPEGQQTQRMMMREILEEEFPNLAKDMNLSPEKAEKLLDLLAKRRAETDMDDMNEEDEGTKDRAASAELARKRAESSRAYVAELKALLGDSYSKWNDYEIAASERRRQEYARMGAEQMRNVITGGGAPLTDQQFAYLNSAITAEQKRIDQETFSVKQQMQRLPETNRRLLEAAAPHLNPQQLDRYKRYLEQQQAMMATIDAMGGLPDD